MNLKKIGKVFTSKFVGTGPSSYKKKNYRAAVSQRLRNTALYCEVVGDGVCNDDVADGISLVTSSACGRNRNVYNLHHHVIKFFVRDFYGQSFHLYAFVLSYEIRFQSNLTFTNPCIVIQL